MKKYFLLSLFSFTLLMSTMPAGAAITGRVVDGSGAPVADATVMYTSINNRLIYAYTCSDGRFSLPGPTEWDVKNLQMYYCPGTGVSKDRNVNENLLGKSLNLTAQGSLIQFHVSGTKKVAINLFSLDGRRVQTVFNNILQNGTWQCSPFSLVSSPLACQAYVVQVANGSEVQSTKLLYTSKSGKGGLTTADRLFQNAGLPKKMASVDTVRAGKTNFNAAFKPIDAFTGDVGDIAITTRDVEAEITTIMTGKSVSWKAYQVCQGVQYATNNNWGTIFYGVGNGGPACSDNANLCDSWQSGTIAAQGTPKLVAIDAVHGFISPPSGTMFPHNIGMGCTRNPLLAELEERITAIELRGMGINWAFAPVVDVPRNIVWGRYYEGWDESPDGTVPMVRGAVRGFQGTDLSAPSAVAATTKHMAGGGGAVGGVNAGNCATGTPAVMARIHLPSFKVCVDNGLAVVMAGMCSWLGTPSHFCPALLTDTLKTAWKFDGFVVGDWDASNSNLVGSFNDGVDNIMEPDNAGPQGVYTAVQGAAAGRLDDACKRILRIKLRLNLMQNSLANRAYLPLIKCAAHTAVARECVRRSMVLLKNDAFNGTKPLPLSTTANVCVVGEFADDMYMQCGGWCMDWPSGWDDNPKRTPPTGLTLRGAIQAVCPNATYSADGSTIPANTNVVVVCVGEVPYAEGGGDIPTQPSTLTQAHKDLITTCVASGKPVVVVLYSGRPIIITDDIAKVPAWVAAWLPGPEGEGMADILFSVNGEKPTGKLSHTWPVSLAQNPINGNAPDGQPYGDVTGTGGTPLFPYGFGLTY
ncbi:MAG TPA: glycoside hydrolase family 3 N-terminal domain-containing protein [Chitinivibrionales bacterium]|nr:glycoside hydrolase family 3 N-terminal domain-containing protein [Chitinivibrionales bacterium]